MEINNSSEPKKDFMCGIARENPRGGGKNCSWCYNGCKNRKVYTSHYMKNKRGEIVEICLSKLRENRTRYGEILFGSTKTRRTIA